MKLNKRGIAAWISWVMIMGFAVALGLFFFAWVRGFATDATSDIVDKGNQITLCESTSVRADKYCQDTQTLNINVTNSNNLRTDELMFRFFDIYDESELRTVNITIVPSETKNLRIVKQGIVKQMEIVPVLYNDKKRIVCESQKVTITVIPIC